MNDFLKLLLSMSCSGSLLILLLLACRQILRHRVSRQWQYYVWLIVIFRLLFPFGAKISPFSSAYQTAGASLSHMSLSMQRQFSEEQPASWPISGGSSQADGSGADTSANTAVPEQDTDSAENAKADHQPPAAAFAANTTRTLLRTALKLKPYLWLIFFSVTLLLLIRRLAVYRSFLRYIKLTAVPVSDTLLLDRLSLIAEEAGMKKPVELCIHPLVSSPLLTGLFHPCIVLPSADIAETDFRYTSLHELMHHKRRDIVYKWLVQITVCLHWFNPLVYVMSREIAKDCEFACDEAVLKRIGPDHARAYGKTLLNAMPATGNRRAHPGTVTLSENKQLLKERLGAIMSFHEKSRTVQILTAALTLCIGTSAALSGVYPVSAKAGKTQQTPESKKDTNGVSSANGNTKSAASSKAERYYKAGSLPLFQMVFSTLSQAGQKYWLNRIYTDGEVTFFSAALQVLDEDSPLITKFAKKAYKDDEAAFFSILAGYMDAETLEAWLNQAIDDGDAAFQSILYDKLELDGEKDAQEEKWASEQTKEYKKYGITMKGKDYYYKGAPVRVFYDPRVTFPAYTLNINPKGTVDIKVVRDKKDKIKKVSYMTKAEVKKMLGDDSFYESLDGLDALDSLDALDALDALDELDQLDELDKLDELDGLSNSKKTAIPINISLIKDGTMKFE